MSIIASQKTKTVELEDGERVFIKEEYNYEEVAQILEVVKTYPGENATMADNMYFSGKICQIAVVGWENVKDDEGKDVPFSKEVLKQIKGKAVIDLSDKIIEQVGLVEKKSSDSSVRSQEETSEQGSSTDGERSDS